MSAENVDFVRASWEPWIDGRVDEFAGFLAEDVGWDLTAHPLPDFPDVGTGRRELLHHLAGYARGWVDYRAELMEAIDAGDDVIVVLHEWASLQGSGLDLERDLVLVWTVADGRFTHLRAFPTREEALAATGSP